MSVAIRRDGLIKTDDLIRRSPVAEVPGAEEVLRDCIYRSIEVRLGIIVGKPACVWGLIPPTLLSCTAYLWLLTTDIIAEHKFLFVRHSQRYIEEALKEYPEIVGDVIGDNPSAVRWIRWLGGEFQEPIMGRRVFRIKAK